MKLLCALCHNKLDEEDFTPFARNPALKDRHGKTPICRQCASQYVVDRGNTKEALKEVLRLQDIPYIESFADSAFKAFKKKIKNTNLVTKKNIYNGKETESIESITIQNSIYTCYCSRLGVMPKKFVNFSFSDGIREVEKQGGMIEVIEPLADTDEKKIRSATKYLNKLFNQQIVENQEKLAKAIELKMSEYSLHTNDVNARQDKFKLKNHVTTLIDLGKLDKKYFTFLCGEEEETPEHEEEDIEVVETVVDNTPIELPEGFDLDRLKDKWGEEFKTRDLVKFEEKYIELRKNYDIKTSAHDEFLRHACIASVRARQCFARNDIDGAKAWMGIFKDTTSAGKLQPSQMSKADLSGGLNNFSEFYRSLEEVKGIIEILPEFKRQPRDDADFVIWCNINYMRRLKGLPDCKYEDIWEFYEEMVQSYDEKMIDDNDLNDNLAEYEDEDEEIDNDLVDEEVDEDE
jgi:hypothetical protein